MQAILGVVANAVQFWERLYRGHKQTDPAASPKEEPVRISSNHSTVSSTPKASSSSTSISSDLYKLPESQSHSRKAVKQQRKLACQRNITFWQDLQNRGYTGPWSQKFIP